MILVGVMYFVVDWFYCLIMFVDVEWLVYELL